mmetsp:Transcript_41908/g.164257  ORF Transcript_41908/g.164257 Transcript_41908/m.164257 type:complete len:87 (-) Transcript_41908:171-431(-)
MELLQPMGSERGHPEIFLSDSRLPELEENFSSSFTSANFPPTFDTTPRVYRPYAPLIITTSPTATSELIRRTVLRVDLTRIGVLRT